MNFAGLLVIAIFFAFPAMLSILGIALIWEGYKKKSIAKGITGFFVFCVGASLLISLSNP